MTTVTHRTQIDGPAGALYVDDGGAGGIPVVLVHSFGGSTAQWAPQLKHLRRTRRAIALDLRGHGRSAAPDDADYAVPSLAADVGAVVAGLELTNVVLVGHGLGAKVAIEYAGTAPDHVAGLLIAAAPASVREALAAQMRAALEADYEKTSASINARLLAGASGEVRELIERDAARIGRDAGLRIIAASFDHDPIPALRRYPGPKLAVTTRDADTPDDLHRLVQGVAHQEMTGTSHWMQLEEPDEFNRILDRFLDRVGGSS